MSTFNTDLKGNKITNNYYKAIINTLYLSGGFMLMVGTSFVFILAAIKF